MPKGDSNEWMSAQDRVDRARGLFQSGKLDEAAMELRRALATEPERGDWHHNLAVTLDALGRHGEAMASYERAIELVPNHPHALIGAAQGSLRAGKAQQCIKYCERAVSVDSKLEPAYALRILALGLLGRHEDAESVYFLAQQYLNEMPMCLGEMAQVLVSQGKFERAIWCYRESIAQNSKVPAIKTRLGVALLRSGQHESAHQVLIQALREQPGDATTILALGSALESLGRTAEAEEKYRRIVELEPANPVAHVRLGDIAFRAGRLDEARSAYSLVITLGLRDVSVRLRLVEVLARLGLRTQAKHQLESLFAREPIPANSPVAIDTSMALGAAGVALDCSAAPIAAKILAAAVGVHPEEQRLWKRFARACFESGARREGWRAARHALRLERNCTETLHNLALDAYQHGEFRRAWAALSRGLKSSPCDEGLRKIRMRIVWKRVAAVVSTAMGKLLGRARPKAA